MADLRPGDCRGAAGGQHDPVKALEQPGSCGIIARPLGGGPRPVLPGYRPSWAACRAAMSNLVIDIIALVVRAAFC